MALFWAGLPSQAKISLKAGSYLNNSNDISFSAIGHCGRILFNFAYYLENSNDTSVRSITHYGGKLFIFWLFGYCGTFSMSKKDPKGSRGWSKNKKYI